MTGPVRTDEWRVFWTSRRNRWKLAIVVAVLVLTLYSLGMFLERIEVRKGAVIDDPVLYLFDPVDLTWWIFGLIYGAMVLALVDLLPNPVRFLTALLAYILLVWFRMVLMYLAPLDPPPTMIVLADPLVEKLNSHPALTRDLFFSGHTSTLFLLGLVSSHRWRKRLFYVATLLVGLGVVLQHVHYAVDVAVAPFVAFASFRLSRSLMQATDIKAL